MGRCEGHSVESSDPADSTVVVKVLDDDWVVPESSDSGSNTGEVGMCSFDSSVDLSYRT